MRYIVRGKVTVKTGRGHSFKVFPACRSAACGAREELHCRLKGDIDSAVALRLFLANQDIQARRAFQEVAASVEAELVCFESLELASRALRDEKFDAIFADAELPRFSRAQFTRLVRKSKFNSLAPIVLLSGYDGGRAAAGTDNVLMMAKPSLSSGLPPFLKQLKRELIKERRGQRRLSYRTDVSCITGLRHLRARTFDLSTLGMLLEGSLPFKTGVVFEAHFQLEVDSPAFVARVRVVRTDSVKRLGVTFLGLGAVERRRLRHFLDQHMPPLT